MFYVVRSSETKDVPNAGTWQRSSLDCNPGYIRQKSFLFAYPSPLVSIVAQELKKATTYEQKYNEWYDVSIVFKRAMKHNEAIINSEGVAL
jgi:hypothetical protein